MDRRLTLAAAVLAGAVVGGLAMWLTAPVEGASVDAPKTAVKRHSRTDAERDDPAEPSPAHPRGPLPEPAAAGRSPAPEGDDPELRGRLETQVSLAAPYWLRVAPRMAGPDRDAVSAMLVRMRAMNEPSAKLANDEYQLAQALLTEGGFDAPTTRALQYIDSTAASVIQGGDPAEVGKPER